MPFSTHRRVHIEDHALGRVGWLRAAVLGANDGIVSTASLIIGVASAGAPREAILIAGVAALTAGAMSMAAGEYVSVSSQADAERAELDRERQELRDDLPGERAELARIWRQRGLTPELARQVSDQLMAKDALAAHARDELGITSLSTPRPVQAAFASAASFTFGATPPLAAALLAPAAFAAPVIAVTALAALALLGAAGAWAGQANPVRAVRRVVFWGALAMAVTAGIGALFGAAA